jgi:hypothetical protein
VDPEVVADVRSIFKTFAGDDGALDIDEFTAAIGLIGVACDYDRKQAWVISCVRQCVNIQAEQGIACAEVTDLHRSTGYFMLDFTCQLASLHLSPFVFEILLLFEKGSSPSWLVPYNNNNNNNNNFLARLGVRVTAVSPCPTCNLRLATTTNCHVEASIATNSLVFTIL